MSDQTKKPPKKPPAKLTDKQREALDKGRKSFKSGDEWSKEQHAKGVAASVQKRQTEAQARTFAAILAEELNVINEQTGKPRKNGVAKKLVEAMEKAKPKEAAKLFEVLRDTLGEAPTQKIDLNANVKTIGNWREALTETEEAKETEGGGELSTEEETETETAEEARNSETHHDSGAVS